MNKKTCFSLNNDTRRDRWVELQSNLNRNKYIYRKILCCYVVGILIFASFVVMVPNSKADNPSDFIITFYEDGGSFTESSKFDVGDVVFVNITLDGLSGDPVGSEPYCLFVKNNDTTESIYFPVWDNDTSGPWDEENQDDDGSYWGYFNLTDSEDSHPPSGPGDAAVLNCSAGDTIYLYEDNGVGPTNPLWDDDLDVASTEIIIDSDSGNEQNSEPDISSPNPSNNSIDVSIDLSTLNVTIEDPEGDYFNWSIETSPYIGGSSSSDDNNGTCTCGVGGLNYNTTYYWFVNCTDSGSGNWENETFSFTTIADDPGSSGNNSPIVTDPDPTNESTISADSLSSLNISISDPEGDSIDWSIETSPYIGDNSATNDVNGTKTSEITEQLTPGSTYYWFVNCTDSGSGNWTKRSYWFTISSSPPGGDMYNVSGYVLDSVDEGPIQGADLTITDNASFSNNAVTDSQGYYMFQNVPAGDYDVVASMSGDPGFGPIWQSITVFDHDETNFNFTVSFDGGGDDGSDDPGPGEDGIEGEVNISVVGTVYMERSMVTISGVNLTAYPKNDDSNILNNTFTDQNGQFQLNFVINQSISENSSEICFMFSAEGYETNDDWQMGLYDLMDMMEQEGQVMMDMVELAKIWNTTAFVNGTILDLDTNNPISNVTVELEGPNYFENRTQTDNNGNFSVGSITGDESDFELMFDKEGYFTNASEINDDGTISAGDYIELGTIYMEVKPSSNAFIEGYLKSEGNPIEDANLMLYDPAHPYESEKGFFDMPTTDSNGYYNISTYAGEFYLITLANIVGESRHGPPLGIGGYVNQVIDVDVSANETVEQNINLTASNPDNINVNLNIINSTFSYARISRTISCNPRIVRLMTDANLDGVIDSDEGDTFKSSINSSFTSSGYFDEDMLLARIPFTYYKLDGTYIQPQQINVDITGIIGDADSSDLITVYVNMSMVPSGQVDSNESLHSIRLEGYYGNPAFNTNYTVQIPQVYSFKNKREWMLTNNLLNSTTLRSVPNTDPDLNDTSFTEPIIMAVGTTNPSAEFNEGYFYENPYDSDGDGDYDYFISKVKVNATHSGTYKIEGKLCSSNGIAITNTDTEKTLSSGSNTIELSFEAEKIYRKKINGPYTIVYDLSYSRNSSYIWFDSMQKVTSSYSYSDFTKPDIFFTGTIIDSGLDEDGDGLYDYLQIGLQVDVGTTGYYEFEGDIGTCDFSIEEPHITGVNKGITFVDYGEQYVNLTFDGGSIYSCGANASIWVFIRVRSQTGSELDDIDTMTDKYYYTDFSPPPPESCTVTGFISDAHGDPVDAGIWLWSEQTMSENTTQVNQSTGEYSINAKPGVYELCINPSNTNYDGQYEIANLQTNETLFRNITLLPSWSQCAYLDMMMDSWQYAAGDNIFINISASSLPNSNCTLEIFKEFVSDGGDYGQEYYSRITNTTDLNGRHMFVIDTTGYTNGEYMFRVWVENESYSTSVARDDRWDIQISSLSLDFEIDKNNYRPGTTGVGTYMLTYISNSTEVVNASYSWKILTWDWMGEHTLSSGTFTNTQSGNGTFNFTIPSTADDGDWYDIKLTATDPSDNDVFSSRGIGITEGSIIESVEDYPMGTQGNYDFLVYNVTVNVTSAGTYRVEAGLEDANRNWITFNDTQKSLSTGSNVVQIFFEGEQIKASQAQTGNWPSWVGLFYSTSWDSLDDLDYTTSDTYSKDDFATPDVCFEEAFSKHTIDGSNGYSALVVNATINASVNGSYRIDANLYKEVPQSGGWYDWQGVSWNNSDAITISEGGANEPNTSIVVPIRLEGSDIYNSGYNGPYNVNFNLHREYGSGDTWITNYDPETDINYNYDDFERPGAVIDGITDHGSIGGDLVIGVNINVSSGYDGDYQINGDLQSPNWYWITNTGENPTLSVGLNEINLTFSGENIYSAGYDGPYNLHVSLQNNNDWIRSEFTTSSHSYTDFSTPGAVFDGSHSDQGYDEDNDGYYDYLQVTVPVIINDTSSSYEVSGELYKETSTSWNWITWGSEEFTPSSVGLYNVTLSFSGSQISNSGEEGYYGVNLWLRDLEGSELGHLDFTTDTSYSTNDFDQPSVRFVENSSFPNDYNDSSYLNVDLRINSSETGDYYVRGSLHKVVNQGGWDNWIWITDTEEQITFTTEGEQDITLNFDLSVLQASGYDGPYTASFKIMDSNWNMLDNINDYETDSYIFSDLGDLRKIYFTDTYDDSMYSNGEYLLVNVTMQVNESGTYQIGGDLHKEAGYDWNFIASQWEDFTLTEGAQEIQLYFESLEIYSGIESLSQSLQSTFSSGTKFDIDLWVRKSNEWNDLDHFDEISINEYNTSDFNTGGVTINSVSDEGYNNTGDSKYDYLNITVNVTFSSAGNYELWCDLSKESSNSWNWIGWTNEYVTTSSSDETEEITLQFNGERISSGGYDGPYNLNVEIQNRDTSKRVARYDGTTSSYLSTEFTGSSVEINESAISDTGVDTDNDGDYNKLSIDIPVTSQEDLNVELTADLRKQTNNNDEWISWTNNWTSIVAGESTINIQFDSEIIRSSALDGPYTLRIELWNRDNWKQLDSVQNYQTTAYSNDNFDVASASINTSNISDWGYDNEDSDLLYNYLEVNVSCNVGSSGDYWLKGDLYSDTAGWQWIDNTETYASLDSNNNVATLQFDGTKVRNKGISGQYKVRIELMDDTRRLIDNYDPYLTSSYDYTDFQTSGAEITHFYDRKTDDDDLELNVTVSCSTNGSYWIGADLHKQSGYEWQWISWESNDGNDYLTAGQETNITILFSGETIYNKGVDGPYNIRIELRDQATWTEQDFRESYTTSDYNATDFSAPTVSFVDPTDTTIDWGNDTDSDSLYNYLQLNLTINSTQSGTYWLHGDIEQRSGYTWNWITWKGQEIELDGTGEQVVKLKFDGERIRDSGYNGPYTVRVQIFNQTTWTTIDSIEDYTTNTYSYTDFQTSTVVFVENDSYPTDQGVGTQGSYSNLAVTVAINSSQSGTYFLSGDLHKESGYSWQWISWEGQEISITEPGNHTFTLNFDGAQIRNKGIDGPYQIRLELGSADGEWRQFDIIESYDTNSYNATDFAAAGAEFVDLVDAAADSIYNGNLKLNVTVNSTSSGTYKITGDLHRESGYSWQWVTYNDTKVDVSGSGEQNFSLIFEGSDIHNKALSEGAYHLRLELIKVGTGNMVDSIDKYTTNSYAYTDFSSPCGSLTNTYDSQVGDYLQVNVSVNSTQSKEYQVSGMLMDSSYQDIAWNDNTTTVDGLENVTLLFDGSIINNSELDPAKIYVELRTTSDWELIDSNNYDLDGTYLYTDFGASVTIGELILSGTPNYDGDDYYDALNISANITFSSDSTQYQISASLRDQNGSWITGVNIPATTYSSGVNSVSLSFDGYDIYAKGLNGQYTVSYVSVLQSDVGEIARKTNAFTTTSSYDSSEFEHPDGNEDGYIVGNYSSYAYDSDGDNDYDYLVINVTVNVTETSDDYDLYADLYSSDGTVWIASDYNYSSYNSGVWNGIETAQFYFEGDDIYNSETNGPYMIGYIRLGAYINKSGTETWTLLDEESNVYTTSSYNYSDFESSSVTPLGPSGLSSITASNDPFSPNSDGTKDTTLITVTATAGQSLYLNIYNSSSVIKRTGLTLNYQGSTTYTVTWNGKDDSNSVLSDGTYRIKVSDEATGNQANESDETTQTVEIDTQAPTGLNVIIKNGDTYTTSTSVNLTTISATDNSSKKMRFKNAGGEYTDWEDFQSTRAWTLTATDGSRTVYFQAKDVAGNTATAVSDSITLDTTKPSSVNISITGKGDTPSTYSNDQTVTLSISSEDSTSGVEYMMIANEVTFSGRSWESYNTSKEWSLTSENGVKTVYIKTKDRAGKISDIYSDSITLDTTAPTSLGISINSDQAYTNSTTVTLTLDASDTYNMKMRFNNSGVNWSNWESYSQSKSWTLTNTTGTKTVNFQVKDLAGNIATSVSDTINYDTTAPAISNVQSSGVTQTGATITWTTDESSTSVVEYGTTTNYGTTETNTTKLKSHSIALSGLSSGTTYHYRVKSQDRAGNTRTGVDKTFTTSSGADTTPPNAIEALSATDKPNAESTVALSWNQSNAPDFAGYKVYRRTTTFTNVSSSGVQLLTTITTRSTNNYDDTSATDGTTFYYAVTAIDTATPPNENQTVTTVSGSSVDDKAPTTSDNIPSGWQTSEVTVTLTATDDGQGVNKTYYTTDGTDPTNSANSNRTQYTSPFTVGGENELGDGTYTIKFYSYDRNTTPNVETVHTKTLRVDTTDPSTIDNSPSGWQNSTPVTVTLTSSDGTSGVYKTYYTKDGSTPTTSSDEYTTSIVFTSQGNRTLKYFSKDNATNSESVKTSHILIDTVRPTSEVTTLSQYNSIPFNVSWTSTDASSGVSSVIVQVKNGSGSWTTWLSGQSSSGTALFTNGSNGNTYYFRTIATDVASNVENDYESSGDTYTTVVSSTMTASITSPSANDYVRQTLTITGTASGPEFNKYWLNYSSDNGSSWTNIGSSTSTVSSSTLGTWNTSLVAETEYILKLFVLNSTGVNNSFTINITIDNTDPNITSGPSSGSVDENSAKISWTTNESCNATVEYGEDTSYGSTSSRSTFLTSHSIDLTGLSDSTTYHYRVVSYDQAGNSVNSSDYTFTTDEETTSTPPSGTSGGFTGGETSGLSADSGGPYEGTVGSSIEFSGLASGGTSPYSYSWDFGDESTSTDQNPTHSYSAVDTYTATLTVIDDAGSTATDTAEVTVSEATEDDNAPSIGNIGHSPSTVTSDDTVTISAKVTDDNEVSDVNLYWSYQGSENSKSMSGSSTYSATIGPFDAGETVSYSIDAVDNIGQTTQSGTFSFSVKKKVTVEDLEDSNETGVDGMDITTNSDVQNVKVNVEKKDKVDAGSEYKIKEDEEVYSYLEINIEADNRTLEDDDIDSITIKFKVTQEWIKDKKINKSKVKLARFHNGSWNNLSTEMLSEDDTYVYYQAIVTGTSTFAIVGGKVIDVDEDETDDGGEMPWYLIIIGLVIAIFLVIIFLFKAGFLYVEDKNNNKK